ncbi:hypothetical protein INR49_009696 [Caranx melampygus]|nr:hypothetical protein INR49_009696 [Caranx melampygus]
MLEHSVGAVVSSLLFGLRYAAKRCPLDCSTPPESRFLINAAIAEIIFGLLFDQRVAENVTGASSVGNCNVQNL